MVRVAAVGDVHTPLERSAAQSLKVGFTNINKKADILAIAGDLTAHGLAEEAETLIYVLEDVKIPIVCVLGNHDYHNFQENDIKRVLEKGDIVVLDGNSTVIEVDGYKVGFAGTKGFGGGFGLRALPDFGEEIFRKMYREGMSEAEKIGRGLQSLEADFKIVLLHYSPIKETLYGEPPEVYAFLGASIMAGPIDKYGANLVLHGHAHYGTEKGMTSGGVPVRNVAMSTMGRPYMVYTLPGR
ncbi:MAG: metallophosphoesterase [Actinomycetota bacterium]|nr:metallophosphoesterase [Actinomycetota bacterium]